MSCLGPRIACALGCLLGSWVANSFASESGVVFVDARAPSGGDGSSWERAFSDLREALSTASSGSEVRVAAGVYRPAPAGGSRKASFRVGDGVTLLGGYAGRDATDPDARDPAGWQTILSGDLAGDDVAGEPPGGENSFHVVVLDGAVRIEGFTIEGGNADGHYTVDDPDLARAGGGIHARAGSPLISRCVVRWNRAAGDSGSLGGGLYVGTSLVEVRACVFEGNSALLGGAFFGGARLISECRFIENRAGLLGGAIHWGGSAGELEIERSVFIGNSAVDGGAIYSLDTGRGPNLSDCIIARNTATHRGGGLFHDECTPWIVGCTVVENVAALGGGLWNTGTGGIGGARPLTLTNSIVWRNRETAAGGTIEEAQIRGGPLFLDHCDVEGWTGTIASAECFGADPLFVEPDEGDWRLAAGSPCLDVGTSEGASATDIEGNARPCSRGFDLGALERCIAAGTLQVVEVAERWLSIVASSEEALSGFSLGARLEGDCGSRRIVDVLPGAALAEAGGADYLEVSVLEDGRALRTGCVVSQDEPLRWIVPGDGLEFLRVAVCGGERAEGSCLWAFADDVGSPPAALVFVDAVGSSVRPETESLLLDGGGPYCFSRGDANSDGRLDIADPIRTLVFLFLGFPIACEDAADTNDDGALDLSDAVSGLLYLFQSGRPPPDPFFPRLGMGTPCGLDPTEDALGCEGPTDCIP